MSSPAQEHGPEPESYHVKKYGIGLGASLAAGALSGLLGIGGGPIKVPVMYLVMGIPLRVATAASNFMIGVTAATSAYIYCGHGNIRLDVTAPLLGGVFLGSISGARLASRVRVKHVQLLLIMIMACLGVQMLVRIIEGKVG